MIKIGRFCKMNGIGLILCVAIAALSWVIGQQFTVIGSPVIAIVIGMTLSPYHTNRKYTADGIAFSSKKLLQYAVILLGFGLNLSQVLKVGVMSLPVIIVTVSSALLCGVIAYKVFKIDYTTATLVSVGTSICGGSAIAATAPVINAKDDEVSQAISVIFLFNIFAVVLFPYLGEWLNLSHAGFALFSGTAVNDTSSVTATATIWDSLHHTAILNDATVVKLTRTLAIIPITLILSLYQLKKAKSDKKTIAKFPMFILYFILASLLTTISSAVGVSTTMFKPFTQLSKFLIVVAMSAIGLNTNIVKLAKTGGKAILLGAISWGTVITMSLMMQWLLELW